MPLTLTKRGGIWHITGTFDGKRVRKSTETGDHALAETARSKREHELHHAKVFGQRAVASFAQAAASYLEAENRKPSTGEHVRKLLIHFGERPLRTIKQEALDGAYAAILRDGHAATGATKLRAVLTPLRAIMEHAAEREWCDRPAFRKPKVAKATTTFLLPDQATALVQGATALEHRVLLTFLIGTGVRMGEALDLDWSRVDLRGARAVVWQKQQNERQVDLPPVVVAALASLPHRDGFVHRPPARLWRGNLVQAERYADTGREGGGQMATAWATACRRAGLPGRMMEAGARPYWQPDLGPHACRHTWASWHNAIHRDPLRLMVAGGWSSLAQVQRYAHLLPAAYADDCRAWLAGGVMEARMVG